MCGFTAYVGFGADHRQLVEPTLLISALNHRGPDDNGHYRSDIPYVQLTANRLAILDLSPAGHMPMPSSDGRFWIIFNGEIYNFRELRAGLERQGRRFRSNGDTEVVLQLYEEMGSKALEQLRGIFAFAIWDDPNQTLFAATDRFGVKPIYYCENQFGVALASELRTLLLMKNDPAQPNGEALIEFLSNGSVPAPFTAVRGAAALSPASTLTVKDGRVAISSYWRLGNTKREAVSKEPAKQVRQLLEDSMAEQLVSDAPLGIFLSGGIDSSAIAILASNALPSPVTTLSISFQETSYSEGSVSREMAKHIGSNHVEKVVTEKDAIEILDTFLSAVDQPTVDGFNTFLVSALAHKVGLKVALSGLGGDEVFGGYPSFQTVPKIAACYSLAMRLFLPPIGDRLLGMVHSPRLERLLEAYRRENDAWHSAYRAMRGVFSYAEASKLLPSMKKDVTHALKSNQKIELLADSGELKDIGSKYDRVSILELRHYLANQLLCDTDIFSMAHSLEVRVPLLDHRLVEYVFGLPDSVKAGGNKQLLVAAMGRDLPNWLLDHPKRGFSLPWLPWLQGDLGKELRQRALAAADRTDGFVSKAAVDEVWRQFVAGRGSWTRPWASSILAIWTEKQFTLG